MEPGNHSQISDIYVLRTCKNLFLNSFQECDARLSLAFQEMKRSVTSNWWVYQQWFCFSRLLPSTFSFNGLFSFNSLVWFTSPHLLNYCLFIFYYGWKRTPLNYSSQAIRCVMQWDKKTKRLVFKETHAGLMLRRRGSKYQLEVDKRKLTAVANLESWRFEC